MCEILRWVQGTTMGRTVLDTRRWLSGRGREMTDAEIVPLGAKGLYKPGEAGEVPRVEEACRVLRAWRE